MTPPPLASRVTIQCSRRGTLRSTGTQSDLEKVDVPTTIRAEGGVEYGIGFRIFAKAYPLDEDFHPDADSPFRHPLPL